MKSTILVADDEKLLLRSLREALSGNDYLIVTAENGRDALNAFNRHHPDLVLLDVRLPDIDGMELFRKILHHDPHCPGIIMTAYGGIKGAVEAIKLGAYDYIAKPFDIEELKFIIKRCLESKRVAAEMNHIRAAQKNRFGFEKIITGNSSMMNLIGLSRRVAEAQSTVLITGESGTGKELFASAIHYNGVRQNQPFVAINCTALSEGLLESELFGHEKGAFTGAIKKKKGLFEMADKGTIFLDEIGEIGSKTQVKLLRFLEARNFQRVGGTDSIEVDVRIIAATNKDLLKEVKSGRFREDLFYRLSVISIDVPPLRLRKDDIPLLINHFIEEYNGVFKKNVRGCSNEAVTILCAYEWPGNIRELRNIIERAVLLCDGRLITPVDIPFNDRKNKETQLSSAMENLETMSLNRLISLYVKDVLTRYGENKAQAASAMGITRQRLRRIIQSPEVD
ncbi:MAG: Transcriptional regulatory protein ZraR [Smithella sp. PtaU1.Bin162]|nr:MAG: Transcriptional regulatory protein ZraR [Smithella sp. PtaU1.Bin162]